MKRTGMLVLSLRGVTFKFWFRLGCSGQNVIIVTALCEFSIVFVSIVRTKVFSRYLY